ncbi:hypothetical protein [Thermomonas sp.]|uniref:hypothetical protein n=1 Tax=Thermomonas sp. TaxID=1971895 RepID=UPI0035AD9932
MRLTTLAHCATVLLLLLSPLAANAADTPADRAAPGVDALPAIALARAPDGRWSVRYALPAPATRLVFSRPDTHGIRARDWAPLDPAFRIAVEDGIEVVRRQDGRAFREAAFAMRPLYVSLEKDYAPFSPFGDGGLLLYTGRFHACADRCEGLDAPAWRLTLVPPANQHAIVGGRVVDTVDVMDGEDGTNLYVGSAVPVETPDVVAVIDAAMPTDIRTRLTTLLPRLMAVYAGQLGALPTKPMLFASRDAAHPGGGYGYQGGTLPGQVFMHLYGDNPAFATPAFAGRLDAFFAHEAAHLYQHYPEAAQADTWIHEGGADALAAVALRQLGEGDPAAVPAQLAQARTACATSLAAGPLAEAGTRGDFDAYYRCGFVLQMAVDAAVRRASNGQCDLFCVWRDFQGRVRNGAPWTGATFIAAARSRGGDAVAEFLRAATEGRAEAPGALLASGMAAAGLPAAE